MAGELGENGDPMEGPDEEESEELASPGGDEGDEPAEEASEPMYTISPAGREMFVAVFAIEDWLDGAPGGPLSLVDDDEAQAIVGAFIDGWTTGITHALAAGPLNLPELERVVEAPDREELEATVAAMRGAGLLSARPSDGEGASYAITDWMREAVGPLVVAMRSELRQAAVLAEEEEEPLPDDPAFMPRDVETVFLLALPLLELPPTLSGVCRLIVDLPDSDEGLAGATIHVEAGRVASCSVNVEGDADAWALGSAVAWMDAAIEGVERMLELGGETGLVGAVLSGAHERLFGSKPLGG